MKNVVHWLPAASLVPAIEVPGDHSEEEHDPPQKLAPPTVFMKKYDEVEKLTSQEGDVSVAELSAMVDKLAIEADPELQVATVDLTQSPTPTLPAGMGVPNTAGTHPVDRSTSDSSSTDSSSEEGLPSADPAVPAAVAAIAAAKRDKVSMAGDITEGREDVHWMQEYD